MIYIINVDTQPSSNPSEDLKQYSVDIEELRYKKNKYDTLVITRDEDYVMRRLALSEYHVLTELSTPVKEPLDINIELFEGDNYIYITNMTGEKLYAEYLIKNDFTDLYVTIDTMNSAITQSAKQIELKVNQTLEGYSTTEEMNAAITLKAKEINSVVRTKVGEDEIISKINQSAEEVSIEADKISLEGYTTINGGFAVDENGNASIANGTVKINENGIQMADNSRLVQGNGIYTDLHFECDDWQELGYWIFLPYNPAYKYINIAAYIPNNFTIIDAYMKITFKPISWTYDGSDSQVGYPRNINIYYEELTTGTTTPIEIGLATEFVEYRYLTTNTNTFDRTGSASQYVTYTSSDLSSFLTSGKTTLFQIRTSVDPDTLSDTASLKRLNPFYPTYSSEQYIDSDCSKTRAARTGHAKATLNIRGYTEV